MTLFPVCPTLEESVHSSLRGTSDTTSILLYAYSFFVSLYLIDIVHVGDQVHQGTIVEKT